METWPPCWTEVLVCRVNKLLMNHVCVQCTHIRNLNWNPLLSHITKTQLRFVISTPTDQGPSIQYCTCVPRTYADWSGSPSSPEVNKLGGCSGRQRCVIQGTVTKQSPFIKAPTRHTAIDQMGTTDSLANINSISVEIQTNDVLQRSRICCIAQTELIDIV